MRQPLARERGNDDEHGAEEQGDGQHGPTQRLLGDLVFLGDLLVRRPGERAVAEAERLAETHHSAQHRDLAVAVRPAGNLAHVDRDLAVGLAHRDRPRGRAAHHHTFEDRLAAHVAGLPRRAGLDRVARLGHEGYSGLGAAGFFSDLA